MFIDELASFTFILTQQRLYRHPRFMRSHNNPHLRSDHLVLPLGFNDKDSFPDLLLEFTNKPKLLFKTYRGFITRLRNPQPTKLKRQINVISVKEYQVYGITEELPTEAMQRKHVLAPGDFGKMKRPVRRIFCNCDRFHAYSDHTRPRRKVE